MIEWVSGAGEEEVEERRRDERAERRRTNGSFSSRWTGN